VAGIGFHEGLADRRSNQGAGSSGQVLPFVQTKT
jgi:hypothetical protein